VDFALQAAGTRLRELIERDPARMRMLAQVRALALPDCWIGAGFVRNAVWDALHQRPPAPPRGDVDVIWHDPVRCSASVDRAIEARLRAADGGVNWSVKNQARMHIGNGDAPYGSACEAMRHWPETATAVALRLDAAGAIEIAAPYGLDDLFEGIVRPTLRFVLDKREVFDARWQGKNWLGEWPLLRLKQML
jgi:hypothetical protein